MSDLTPVLPLIGTLYQVRGGPLAGSQLSLTEHSNTTGTMHVERWHGKVWHGRYVLNAKRTRLEWRDA